MRIIRSISDAAVVLTLGVTLGSAASTGRFRLSPRYPPFDYVNDKVRGVNLGGWLVAEPWITPQLFQAAGDAAVDEFTIGQAGFDLTNHWQTWITEDDIAQIAAAGLNHVRIPIGYWSVIETPPFRFGAIDYLDQAIVWARTHGVKVLIDLHGGSLSQNGFDNSGKLGNVEWGVGSSVGDTLAAVNALAQRYKGDTDVVGSIELLNEPRPGEPDTNFPLSQLQQFCTDGQSAVNGANSNFVTTVQDAFQSVGGWQDWGNDLFQVMIDTHIYYVFDDGQLAQDQASRIGSVCAYKSELAASNKWAIVGEWCSARTDCALWLNGRYRGARADGSYTGGVPSGRCQGLSSGTVDALSADEKSSIRQMNEAQIDAYEGKTGWIYWTWKTEGAPEWDMQAQLLNGLFPQPIGVSREFGYQCGQ